MVVVMAADGPSDDWPAAWWLVTPRLPNTGRKFLRLAGQTEGRRAAGSVETQDGEGTVQQSPDQSSPDNYFPA